MRDPLKTSRHACLRILLPLILAALAGCTAIAVGLGLRVRLDKVPVTALSASLSAKNGAGVQALAPGQSAKLVIVATDKDGHQFVTAGAGHGKVLLDSFTYDPNIVQVNKKGAVMMPADPRVSEGKVPQLRITPVGHPDVTTELQVPVRYDVMYQANFSGSDGAPGSDGFDGTDGMSGSSGSPGAIDPATGIPGTPAPGGDGTNGGNGTDGSSGGDGSPGSAVSVWMRLTSDKEPLLQIKVAGAGRESLYLVDPNGGSLKVQANGGRGGQGGRGGRAGRGGSGGDGFPSGLSGSSGSAGWDGHAGADGPAGTITVWIDPQAEAFRNHLALTNLRGDGRPGPAPSINVEPVPALW